METPEVRSRFPWRIVCAVALVCSALFAVLIYVDAHGQRRPPALVATPGPDASPEQVVQAYVDGINAKDTDVVHSVTTAKQAEFLDRTWLKGGYLTQARINENGVTTFEGNDRAIVQLTFVDRDSDVSMNEGEEYHWSVVLVREDKQWLVDDMGWM